MYKGCSFGKDGGIKIPTIESRLGTQLGRFQKSKIPDAVSASIPLNLVIVDNDNLFQSKKNYFIHWSYLRAKSDRTAPYLRLTPSKVLINPGVIEEI